MLNVAELPASTQKELKRVVGLTIAEMTNDDKAFIRARRDYLSEADSIALADVIGNAPAAPTPEPGPETPVEDTTSDAVSDEEPVAKKKK